MRVGDELLPGDHHGDVVAAVLQHVHRKVVVCIHQAVVVDLRHSLTDFIRYPQVCHQVHSQMKTYTGTHSHTKSLTHSLSHTHTKSLTHSHTHTHTHSFTHSHTHTHSFTHTHTHTHNTHTEGKEESPKQDLTHHKDRRIRQRD